MLPSADYLIGGGVDYDSMQMICNVTFTTGATCAVFNISIHDDMLSENDEMFNVTVMERSLPYGIELGGYHRAVVTIVDNDSKYLHANGSNTYVNYSKTICML